MAALARGTCLVPARAMPGTSLFGELRCRFKEFRCHVTNFDWRRGGAYGERAGERSSERAIISKMYTFINMVMTWVKNRSPDMILTAFDGKFDEKKDEIPPGVHRLPYE